MESIDRHETSHEQDRIIGCGDGVFWRIPRKVRILAPLGRSGDSKSLFEDNKISKESILFYSEGDKAVTIFHSESPSMESSRIRKVASPFLEREYRVFEGPPRVLCVSITGREGFLFDSETKASFFFRPSVFRREE